MVCLQTSISTSFAFTLPSREVNTKICTNKTYLLFHTTVKGGSPTLRDEQTLKLFEKILLKKTFESKGMMKEKAEKLRNERLQNLYCTLDSIMV